MDTIHLVDPELARALAGISTPTLTAELLPANRLAIAKFQATAPPGPGVSVEERFLSRPDGSDLRVLVYAPAAPTRTGGLLWFHGGGMVRGTADQYEAQSRFFAHRLGCVVVVLDYRLAPEDPYPAGLEDGYQALQWLHEAADELQLPRTRIAVAGESGGGCLAAALALYARDHGGPAISAQFLQNPMLDDRTGTPADPDPLPMVGEFLWTAASNRFAWGAVLGHAPGTLPPPVYAAPGRVEGLAGLPPSYFFIGDLDLFVGENLRFVQNLLRNGVPTELHLYAGAYHGFMRFSTGASITQRAEQDFWGALERHFRAAS
ncbi:alpha/beta hydrolase [Hymenobacter terrestris]|uniref:Alpha/beta hydrolase n=1 Tax=Hymenobacter terrestris TaxID=2748310 RepID=A0ABX2Q5R2_9BACT|nr:alpha/beta hydrolase [Hymenobacter terrestris]NVO86318.1 alpha/beta hydrolase [Hymenobacter terrestris]